MFMDETFNQWLGVIEWFGLMIILFTGTFIFSCIIVNKTTLLHTSKKKNSYKPKKIENKSWFIDVA